MVVAGKFRLVKCQATLMLKQLDLTPVSFSINSYAKLHPGHQGSCIDGNFRIQTKTMVTGIPAKLHTCIIITEYKTILYHTLLESLKLCSFV